MEYVRFVCSFEVCFSFMHHLRSALGINIALFISFYIQPSMRRLWLWDAHDQKLSFSWTVVSFTRTCLIFFGTTAILKLRHVNFRVKGLAAEKKSSSMSRSPFAGGRAVRKPPRRTSREKVSTVGNTMGLEDLFVWIICLRQTYQLAPCLRMCMSILPKTFVA